MTAVLFVTWDGGGNLPPALGLAAALRERGLTARFLGHEAQRAAIEGAGFGFTAYEHARPWSSAEPLAGPDALERISAMFTDPGPGADLLETARRDPPAMTVIDALSLSALQAAQRAGLAHVALAHTYYHYLRHAWAGGPIGAAARRDGLDPVLLWDRAGVLVAADPGLDPAGHDRAPNVWHTGVIQPVPRPAQLGGKQPGGKRPGGNQPRGDRPLVLVSLSTIFYPGQEQALQVIIDALGTLPVDAVVTTGTAVDPARLRPAASTQIHRYLPHAEVMPGASLVIGHGGHGTTMAALAHDLPLVIMPMHPALDHQLIGQTVADRGAALVLPGSAPAAAVGAAVSRLLGPGPHIQAAARIGAALRSRPGAAPAANLLMARLAGTHPG